MRCREKCGACCIAPSISSLNKPAGVPCKHLTYNYQCSIFNQPERPKVCAAFQAEPEFCGHTQTEAIQILNMLESDTAG